jgi:gamma-glutamyltranspeptidase
VSGDRFGRTRGKPALPAAVSAGHPATAEAGVEVLADGGSAADAAVAAALASCVAETVMTGLLGGSHAIYWDAGAGRARHLDCFCAVPSGSGGEGLPPQEAVERPRAHVASDVVNAEPGVDEDALAQLESSGLRVRRWPALHHYFGGVSGIGRRGAAADPRRSGFALSVRERA